MEIKYRNANFDDLNLLVECRLDFLNLTKTDDNYEFIKNNLIEYFKSGLEQEKFDSILVEDDNTIVGTGIIFYYNSVPSLFNPSGKNAYITSMFVNDNYRRRGIATNILDKLVQIAKRKGYNILFLNESAMGKPVYEKYGFQKGKSGMVLKL